MSYAKGRFGIEYTPRRRPDNKSGGLRWLLVVIGLLLIGSFIVARLLLRQKPARIEVEDRTAPEPTIVSIPPAPVPPAA